MTTIVDFLVQSGFNSKGLDDATAKVQAFFKDMENFQQSAALRSESFIGLGSGQQLEEQITKLKRLANEWRAVGQGALAAGNAQKLGAAATNLTNIEGAIRTLERFRLEQKRVEEQAESLVTRLNNLGFTFFKTQSTIQTFIGLAEKAFRVLEGGAAVLDRLQGFETLGGLEGIDTGALRQQLEDAAQGAITLDTALTSTLRLIKAGFPEIASRSDDLLRIAVNAAVVSGEVDKAEQIYEKLIRGIVRGSPRLIDDADIILKLGDANERFAASLGKTVEELTANERVMATYLAVVEEGKRINELAANVDSAALEFAKLKTATQESIDALKAGVASLAIEFSKLGGEGGGGVVVAVARAFGANESQLKRLNAAFGTTAKTITTLFAVMRTMIQATGRWIGALVQLGKALFEVSRLGADAGKSLTLLFTDPAALGEPVTKTIEAVENLKTVFDELAGDGFQGFGDLFRENLKEAGIDLNNMEEAAEDALPSLDDLGDGALIAADKIKRMQEQIFKANLALQRGTEKAARDLQRKLDDIARTMADKLADISQDLRTKLARLAEDRAITLARIAQDLSDKLEDIDSDLATKLSRIQEDARDKESKAREDHKDKLEDLERKHQRNLDKIMRRFQLARLKALIDRDARALFEAERQRDEALKDEVDQQKDARKNLNKELERKLKDIKKAEEKQRRDAIEAAKRRREDAIKAAQRQREDAIRAFEERRRDAMRAAEERRQDALRAAQRQREDALRNHRDRLFDLRQSNADRLAEIRRSNSDVLNEMNAFGSAMKTQNAGMLNDILGQWQDAANQISSIDFTEPHTELIPIGTTQNPDSGIDDVGPGKPCSTVFGGGNMFAQGPDGKWYRCVNGTWQLWTPGGALGSPLSGSNIISGDSRFSAAPTGGGTTGTVRITVENDDTLRKILDEMTYDAVVDLMSNA